MSGVPSQLSWVALWADIRVIGLVVVFCVFLVAVLALLSAGLSTGLSSAISGLVRIGRLVFRR